MKKPAFLPTSKELKQLVNAKLYKEIYHDYKQVKTGKLPVQEGYAHSIKLIKKSHSQYGHIMLKYWQDYNLAPFLTRKQVFQDLSQEIKTAWHERPFEISDLNMPPRLAQKHAVTLKHYDEELLAYLERTNIKYFMNDDDTYSGYRPADYHCFDIILSAISDGLETELAPRHPEINTTKFVDDNKELNATIHYLTHHVLNK